MSEFLSVVCFAVHLLLMNLATAGPLLALLLNHFHARGDRGAGTIARQLTLWSLYALGAGTLLGVLTLVGSWREHGPMLAAAAEMLPARRYWFGGAELLFSALCQVWYLRRSRKQAESNSRREGWFNGGLLFLAGSNLAYHFPPLFAMLGIYSQRPERWNEPISFLEVLVDPEVIGHWLHFLLASATVGGLAITWLAQCVPVEGGRNWSLVGGRIALGATVLELVSGVHLLFVTPEVLREAMLGGDTAATLYFVLAIGGAILLLHRLASMAFGEVTPRELFGTLCTLGAIVLCMTGAMHASRQVVYRTLGPRPARVAQRVDTSAGQLDNRASNRIITLEFFESSP